MERQKRLKVTAHLVTGIVILAALALGIVGTIYGVGATNNINNVNSSTTSGINSLQASVFGNNGQSNDSSSAIFNIAALQQQNQDQELKISALNTNMSYTMGNLTSVTSATNANTALLAQTATPLRFIATPSVVSGFSPICNAANKNSAYLGATNLVICDGVATYTSNITITVAAPTTSGTKYFVPQQTQPGSLYLGILSAPQTCAVAAAGLLDGSFTPQVTGDLGKYAKMSTAISCGNSAAVCDGVCMCDGSHTYPMCVKVY